MPATRLKHAWEVSKRRALKIPLAMIGLVCLEARGKFKNIDFHSEASYCTQPMDIYKAQTPNNNDFQWVPIIP